MNERLPQWLGGKESACNAGDTGDAGSISGLRRSPGGRNDNPFQYPLPGKFHGQRSLATVQGVAKSWTRLND